MAAAAWHCRMRSRHLGQFRLNCRPATTGKLQENHLEEEMSGQVQDEARQPRGAARLGQAQPLQGGAGREAAGARLLPLAHAAAARAGLRAPHLCNMQPRVMLACGMTL